MPNLNLDEGRYHISPIFSILDGHNPSYKQREITQRVMNTEGDTGNGAFLQEDWGESDGEGAQL